MSLKDTPIWSGLRAFCAALLVGAAATAAERPNIVYILADDLGYGDVGVYGQKLLETPNLDKLARAGMLFTQHYSGSAVCAPSRAALLTGLHTGHAPVRGNYEVEPEGQYPMPEGTRLLSRALQSEGYATGIFGKWGLGAPDTSGEPLRMGFDRFYGYNCQRMAHNYYPYFLWNDAQREMLWDNFGLATATYAPDLIHRQALEFIRANRDRPFFCFYAMVQPHAEMFAQERYMRKYRGKFLPESSYAGIDDGPEFRRGGYGSQPEAHAAFAAMVNSLDDYVGDVMQELERLGIADNTLVIFTSDNGPHREGGHDPDYFDSNGPVRGYKRDLYEGGIRVPMIVQWPGKVKPSSVSPHVSAFWDVFPTIAEIVGIEIPDKLDGISFLPTLTGDGEQRRHEYLYWEFHELGGRQAVRAGDWKGVRYNVAERPASTLELYDLAKDPGETQDLAQLHPEVVRRLSGILQNARTPHPDAKFNFPPKK